jgi:pyrimidine operon attenuation protein / uracil phosphoribosyltransferase
MQKKLILDQNLLSITLDRLCHQLVENHGNFSNSVLIGLQPRGIFLADRVAGRLQEMLKKELQLGYLDTTFHRDDYRMRSMPIMANATTIPFIIDHKEVILIDDVLFTGRSVRAALDAMIAFGRPKKVELLVLVDRRYTRDLPIEPNYVGVAVNTMQTQKVLVEWREHGKGKDSIWLINNVNS